MIGSGCWASGGGKYGRKADDLTALAVGLAARGVSSGIMEALRMYDRPGNVRELENAGRVGATAGRRKSSM